MPVDTRRPTRVYLLVGRKLESDASTVLEQESRGVVRHRAPGDHDVQGFQRSAPIASIGWMMGGELSGLVWTRTAERYANLRDRSCAIAALLTVAALATACADETPEGGGGSGGAGGAGGAPASTADVSVRIVGRGGVQVDGQSFQCEEESPCEFTAHIVNPAATIVLGTSWSNGWLIDGIKVDGLPLLFRGDAVIPLPTDIEVRFVELPECTPTADPPGAPSGYLYKEACAGQPLLLRGQNLANDIPPLGVCLYLRGALVPEITGKIIPDEPNIDAWTSNRYQLVVRLPSAYPPGPAIVFDRTLEGELIEQVNIVADLAEPVIESLSPSVAHEGDVVTITGTDLDHVLFLRFTCLTNCEEEDGGILTAIDIPIELGTDEPSFTVSPGLFSAGQTFFVTANTACGPSNEVGFAYQ